VSPLLVLRDPGPPFPSSILTPLPPGARPLGLFFFPLTACFPPSAYIPPDKREFFSFFSYEGGDPFFFSLGFNAERLHSSTRKTTKSKSEGLRFFFLIENDDFFLPFSAKQTSWRHGSGEQERYSSGFPSGTSFSFPSSLRREIAFFRSENFPGAAHRRAFFFFFFFLKGMLSFLSLSTLMPRFNAFDFFPSFLHRRQHRMGPLRR